MEKLIYSAREAAKVLGTGNDKVQSLLKKGEIPAYREGRNWKIPKKSLEAYVEERARKETERRKYDTAR